MYTMALDLLAVALLLVTGIPDDRGSEVEGPEEGQNSEGRRQNGEAGRRRWLIAGAVGIAWMGIVLAMWLTKPAIVVATTATPDQIFGKPGQTFGKPGELVVLEPEKWIGQHFSLADHIVADHTDLGTQLSTGQWIILLVRHDCDQCVATVPKYVAEYDGPISSPTSHPRPPNY